MSRARQLRDAARFAWGLSKGIKRGDLFPAAGRAPSRHAPGGTTEAQRSGTPLRRLRDEVGWFSESIHTLEVAGLDAPLEILQLTDVHLRKEGAWLDALCGALRGLAAPDLLVLTGDIVTRGYEEGALARFLGSLPPARLGRYAVMGNWEYWCGAEPAPWRARLAEHGIELLVNGASQLGPIDLVGTDDALAGEVDLAATFDGLSGRPVVALTHSPVLFDRLVRPDVSLVLAGHSHAGQVRLPVLGAGWVPMGTGRYVAGWYQQDETHLYVGRGVGWSIAPVRMWCPPEFARIRLVPRR